MANTKDKILIVDDDLGVRKALEVQLNQQGYEVFQANNGRTAIESASSVPPDVILLDLGLPDMDGLQVLEELKDMPALANVPVVIVSGRSRSDVVIKGLDLGAADYITKPYEMPELWARLRAVGRTKKTFDTLEEVNQRLNHARREAEQATRRAEAATRSKNEFLANMSHEIRTPMTAILGYADLIHEALRDRPEILKDVDVVRTNGKYLLELINDILDLAKVEAGKMVMEVIDCSLVEIISQVNAIMRVRAVEKSIGLITKYQGSIPEKIKADPTRIRQALINLVSNAIKFTTEGNVIVETSLVHEDPEPIIQIKVIDSGIGIRQDRLETIFDPFHQADNSTTRTYGGTGLGLSITKRIMEALRGTILVDSELNKGSTFTLLFPIGSLDGVELLENPDLHCIQPTRAQDDIVEFALQGQVLLAEDTPVNQKLIQRMLQKVGIDVDVVDNGKLACEAVQQKDYDIVLMDLHMPIMDGMEATKHILAMDKQPPVLALTADAMRESRERCLHAGFSGYLTKPVVREEMLKELANYLKAGQPSEAQQHTPEHAEQVAASSDEQAHQVMNAQLAMDRMQMDIQTYLDALEETIPWLKEKSLELHKAFDGGVSDELGAAAHAIKSTAGTVGIERVHHHAERLELTAKGKETGDVSALFEELNHSLTEACNSINEYYQSHRGALPEGMVWQQTTSSQPTVQYDLPKDAQALTLIRDDLTKVLERIDSLMHASQSSQP